MRFAGAGPRKTSNVCSVAARTDEWMGSGSFTKGDETDYQPGLKIGFYTRAMLEPGLYRTSDAETYRIRVSLSVGLLCLTLSALIYTLERVMDATLLASSRNASIARVGNYQRIGADLNPLENPFFWIFAALGLFFLGIYFFTPITPLVLTGPVEPPPDDLEPPVVLKK